MGVNDASPTPRDDADLLNRIAFFLRVGMVLASGLVLLGGSLYLARHGFDPLPDRHHFTPEPEEFRSVGGMVGSAASGHAQPIIQMGLVVLIATPIFRVLFTLVAFARRRDWLYASFAGIVLAFLLLGYTLQPAMR